MVSKNLYKRIKNKFDLLDYALNPLVFIYMRYISSLILFICLLFIPNGLILAVVLTFIYYFLLEYFALDLAINTRKYELEKDALEFFPLFLFALNSDRNIKKALLVTCDSVDSSLSSLIRDCFGNNLVGKHYDEITTDMKNKVPSELVLNILVSILESSRKGNNLSDSINLQLKYIEDRINKDILKSYKVVPFKMAIMSLFFVFAVLFLLMLCNF